MCPPISAAPVLVADAGDLPARAAPQRPSFRPRTDGHPRRRCFSRRFLLQLRLLLECVEVLADVGALRGEGPPPPPPRAEPLLGAVEKLYAAGNRCHQPYDEVEAEEDCFLGGAGGEAVHGVRARKAAAGELGLHLEAVQQPLAHQKANFCQYAKGHVDNVKPPQMKLFRVALADQLAAFGAAVPLVMMVHGIHEENQGRRGDEDDVKHPEPVLGDGEGHVVAHLLAAGLEGVAGELLLLIFKQVTRYSPQDQYPEDKHEQEPETTKHRRVSLEVIKESAEEAPFTHDGSAVLGVTFLKVWMFVRLSVSEQMLSLV